VSARFGSNFGAHICVGGQANNAVHILSEDPGFPNPDDRAGWVQRESLSSDKLGGEGPELELGSQPLSFTSQINLAGCPIPRPIFDLPHVLMPSLEA
jgi:hypothetical protein